VFSANFEVNFKQRLRRTS